MKWLQKHKKLIIEIISVLFILLFAYAGFNKLIDGHKFYNNLNNSPLLGVKQIAGITSRAIPLMEIGTAVLLAFRKTKQIGLYVSLGLMSIFTAYVAGILFISPYTPCSCGGVIALLSWNQHFVFNILLLSLVIIAIILNKKKDHTLVEAIKC